ncbi:hypothetical protein ABZ749_30825, partial [Micromonospora sp. NPDC047753]|uniref:hypothetical protein n=1 Tax=Micromonospora sp. NPDC047753 TaxID=3154817 RepID=UPI0033FB77D6
RVTRRVDDIPAWWTTGELPAIPLGQVGDLRRDPRALNRRAHDLEGLTAMSVMSVSHHDDSQTSD